MGKRPKMPSQNIAAKPPASFSKFFKTTKELIEEPLRTSKRSTGRLALIPPTPKQLAERAENTPQFQGVVNDLIRLEDAERYRASALRDSASELLRRSGYYHGALEDHSEGELWERISVYRRPRKAQKSTLMLLDGCVFPRKEFEIGKCTVVRHSAAEIAELGPPPEITESFFPEETLDREWYSQQWFLRSSYSVDLKPELINLRSLLPDFIARFDLPLNTYWPQLLALGLYNTSCFDIPIVLSSEAKWSLERLRFLSPGTEFAAGRYKYDEDGEPIPIPGPTTGYRVRDDEWSQFETFLRFCEMTIDHTRDWHPIRVAARRYLRATFLSAHQTNEDREDILLLYIFALEALLLAGDREAISDKIATRAALICGRDDDERKEIMQFLKRAHNARSAVVHGKEGKKDIDLLRLRDICRQVVVVVLKVARWECGNNDELSRVIKELAISRAIQDTVAKHRDDVFPLIVEIPWAKIYEENPTMPR